MTEKLKLQIKALAVINAILLIAIVLAAMAVMSNLSPPRHDNILYGSLTYLSNQSNPENPKVGVYLKLTLENPKYARFGEHTIFGFLSIANNTTVVGIHLKSKTGNERGGFIVDVEDKNGNGLLDTGDLFHVYGRPLNGYYVELQISGVGGSIQTHIP